MGLVPYGAELDSKQRLDLAMITGAGKRWTFGDLKDRPTAEAIADLHAISPDPVLYGIALGDALATIEIDGWPSYARLAELYRACGADEAVAQVHLEWQRSRLHSPD